MSLFKCMAGIGCGLALAGCARAPAGLMTLANLTPAARSLAVNIAGARQLNQQARRLAGRLRPATLRWVVPALHGALHRQKSVLAQAQYSARELARQAAQNRRAGAALQAALAEDRSRVVALHGQMQAAQRARDQARRRYRDSWLGGKAHRLIDWIIGIGALLLVLDFLASAFLGVGFNPLEWLFGLGRVARAIHH